MSDRITVSFEINPDTLDFFTEAVREKFEDCVESSNLWKDKKGTVEEFRFDRYSSQAEGLNSLYLSCVKSLLEVSHAKSKA